jgi:membrane protein
VPDRLDRLRSRSLDLTARARSLTDHALDLVPGARRTVADLVRIDFVDRTMIISAQALLALTPLLIVLAAFLPADLGSSLVARLEDAMGLRHVRSALLEQLGSDSTRTQAGVLSLLVVLASALSFAKAIQRLHEAVWQVPHRGGLVGRRLCLLWLVGWLLYLQLTTMVSQLFRGELAPARLLLQLVVSTLVWWWTAHTLLQGRVGWRQLWCGALLTAVTTSALAQASHVFMPPYAARNLAQFGPAGLVFSMASWLIACAGAMVVATVLGRVLTEEWPAAGARRSRASST